MYKFQNPELTVDERVVDLLGRMSIEEKLGQMTNLRGWLQYERSGDQLKLSDEFKKQYAEVQVGSLGALSRADWYTGKDWNTGLTPALIGKLVNMVQKYAIENSRWEIPLWITEPTVHGLQVLGATVFPGGIGMGSSWNSRLLRKIGDVIAAEASSARIHRGSPSLDIAREPRWSRVEECMGEDPYLVSELAVAMVKGLQGEAFSELGKVVAVLRHFAGHGDPEGGHNSASAHLGGNELYNIQLKPFRDCVAAGARGIMSSYNTIDGISCTGNYELLTELLRNEWGFKGYVVPDAGAIFKLKRDRLVGDDAEACALAIKSGVDMDLWNPGSFIPAMRQALERGLLDMEDIDSAVGHFLSVKFEMGLFENPFADEQKPKEILGCKAHRDVALEAARESLVLLSNPNRILPLSQVNSLAVIGPNADACMNQLGDYTAAQKRKDILTILDGVKSLASQRNIKINYSKGCGIRSLRRDMFDDAIRTAESSDAAILVLGGSSALGKDIEFLETGAAALNKVRDDLEIDKESGEGYDRASLRLSGLQLELLKELKATGKPVIVVLIMGRPLIINEVLDMADAVLLAWYPGMMGGQAVAEALFGEYNPGGRLPISFPRDEGQLPVYYNTHQPRRNYIDLEGAPRLQFGYGMSYTIFEYSELKLSKKSASIGESITVSVKVINTGKRDGDEVVQLYITDQVASVARPYRELRGFKRIHLKAGEIQTVTFTLGNDELGFYNKELKYVVEAGRFTVAIGGNLDSLIEAEFEISEESTLDIILPGQKLKQIPGKQDIIA